MCTLYTCYIICMYKHVGAVLALLLLLVTAINPMQVLAASSADSADAERASMLTTCFKEFDFRSVVSKENAENQHLYGQFDSAASLYGNSYSPGNERSEVLIRASSLVASDNSMECRSVLGSVLQKLGTNYDDFFDKYYVKIDDNNDGQFDDYGFRSNVSSSKIENDIKKAIQDAGLYAHISLLPTSVPSAYIKAVLSPLFNECFKKSTQDADFTINGQNYVYIGGDGKDARADKVVGMIIDPTDGVWSCREVGERLSNEAGKYGDTQSTLADIVLGDAVSDEDLSEVPSATDPSGTDSQGRNANCMTNANGFGLAWIMCPVYNVAESAMNKILNYMRDIMYTNIGEDSTELKQAWGGLKNVANGVFVVALLVILIGQALKGSW